MYKFVAGWYVDAGTKVPWPPGHETALGLDCPVLGWSIVPRQDEDPTSKWVTGKTANGVCMSVVVRAYHRGIQSRLCRIEYENDLNGVLVPFLERHRTTCI